MLKVIFYSLIVILTCISCGQEGVTSSGNDSELPEVRTRIDIDAEHVQNSSSERDRSSWQKPHLIIESLGDISDKVVADIGAGTGYFSFRMVHKAKRVIAIDIDSSMLQLIDAFRGTMTDSLQAKLETRLARYDDPLLEEGEADVIIIVNTVGYFSDRIAYFKKLKEVLQPQSELVIVDYKVKRLPIDAPPYEDRVVMHLIEEDLYAAGFSHVFIDDTSLDYQYIIKAGY